MPATQPYVWSPDMTLEQEKDGAYWERNMLALYFAMHLIATYGAQQVPGTGWYYSEPRWKGWQRVITLERGKITFHVPDDFDLGALPQIAPNWDGHTTEAKWLRMMEKCGCQLPTKA